ncbi:F-box/kelch-repeat protein At3g23880-like [Nicotiana tabacum]|uniref:F-box/kelch-repeat protein At3g23880-like n=1 Tax=Nicotiana tabacum TaxID=4097 RepID=A0A1S4D1H6_TOBAC|nr:PREDICTED: F-box/kelch-repeat protein At3g23880-like [Nicotiana tabacum]
MSDRSRIPSLPDDIVNSILIKLPVTSLLRFKCICKSWRFSISNPNFIKLHLHESSANISRQKLFFVSFRNIFRSNAKFQFHEALLGVDSKVLLVNPPFPEFCHSLFSDFEVHSCNGLVLMKTEINMILWNPAIRKYKLLPKPDDKLLPWYDDALFDFAYDLVADDYKVVCVKLRKYQRDMIAGIFSINNHSWKRIDNIPIPRGFQLFYQDLVSLNGTINIMAASNIGNYKQDSEYLVISLYLANEKFAITPVPGKHKYKLKLRAFANRICISWMVGGKISIWALKEDGKTGLTWNNIMNIPTLGSLIGKPTWGDFIFLKANGNILYKMVDNDGYYLIEYNVRKDEATEYCLDELPMKGIRGVSLLHVESLVSSAILWD